MVAVKLRWIPAWSLLLAATLVGCGDPKSTNRAGALSSIGLQTSTVSLSDRRQALVLPVGDQVLVFGGISTDASVHKGLSDGSLYDPADASWSALPAAPFSQPLYQASGVWSGDEAIIIGTPCAPTSPEFELASCGKRGIEAAAFSPQKNTWRSLKRVALPDAAGFAQGNPLVSRGLGMAGNQAVFGVDGHTAASDVMLVDVAAEGATRFAKSADRADVTCVAGGKILAVRTGSVSEIGTSHWPDPVAAAEPLRTYTLDQESLAWGPAVETKKPDSLGVFAENVYCSAGQLLCIPLKDGLNGYDNTGGLWWNTTKATWETIPRFESAGYLGGFSIAEIAGTRVAWLWHDTDGKLFILEPGQSKWSVSPAPFEGIVQVGQGTSALVVDPSYDQKGPLNIALLDPSKYASTHT